MCLVREYFHTADSLLLKAGAADLSLAALQTTVVSDWQLDHVGLSPCGQRQGRAMPKSLVLLISEAPPSQIRKSMTIAWKCRKCFVARLASRTVFLLKAAIRRSQVGV
jgi:hypothetical protein